MPDGSHRIRLLLPFHLQTLAGVGGEVIIEVTDPVTRQVVLDALEAQFPKLRGTIRDHATQSRRPFIRFFACRKDLTHEPADARLPDDVIDGREPYLIVGAIAGG